MSGDTDRIDPPTPDPLTETVYNPRLGYTQRPIPDERLPRDEAALPSAPDVDAAFDRAVLNGSLDHFDAGTVRRIREWVVAAALSDVRAEPCPYCGVDRPGAVGSGCLECRGRGAVGPSFRANRGLPPLGASTDPRSTVPAEPLSLIDDPDLFGCGPKCLNRDHPAQLHSHAALPSAPDQRLREALKRIVDLPTVVPDHAHGGVHPPYLEWRAVAEIARAALSEATTRPEATPPGLAAQIEWQIGNAYRNGHRDGLACGVESGGFGITECEHLTEDGYRPSPEATLDVDALDWAINAVENIRAVYPPGAEVWADDRRQKIAALRALAARLRGPA